MNKILHVLFNKVYLLKFVLYSCCVCFIFLVISLRFALKIILDLFSFSQLAFLRSTSTKWNVLFSWLIKISTKKDYWLKPFWLLVAYEFLWERNILICLYCLRCNFFPSIAHPFSFSFFQLSALYFKVKPKQY